MATLGSQPNNVLALLADEMAMSASCEGVGSGLTAASANIKAPFSPPAKPDTFMMKKLEGREIPPWRPMIRLLALMTLAVRFTAPATMPSASPIRTIIAPK